MLYPLPEKIGNPDLFVGRARERIFFGKWIANIPKRLSKSFVILARRKSGKTALAQRLFNQLWNENGEVIPFYFLIQEARMWYPEFAVRYYGAFASQCISFLERDVALIQNPLTLEEIRDYGKSSPMSSFVKDAEFLLRENRPHGRHDTMWDIASHAPHRYAAVYDKRFLVMIDEFQYLSQFIYRDEACERVVDDSMPGSYHGLSESKLAPMLVTGSYMGWLIKISGQYLQGGRLTQWFMSPYLPPEEGLQAVYAYAAVYNEPVTNETALLINQLCMSDPFFISCVMQSTYPDRDLTTEAGVINTVEYELASRYSEMSNTWTEYIELTVDKINDRCARQMLLHLSKHNERYWTPQELKDELQLDLDAYDIRKRLMLLVQGDLIEWGNSDIQFRGLQDGTLNLVLRNRFEQEINNFIPDLKQEFYEQVQALKKENKRLQGMLNNVSGQFAEFQLAMSFRAKKRFALSGYFDGVRDTTRLNIVGVKHRHIIRRNDGKQMELDVIATSDCGRCVVVEVKKWQTKVGPRPVQDFLEKLAAYAQHNPDRTILPAFLSLGGFTDDAAQLCIQHGIATADRITCFS